MAIRICRGERSLIRELPSSEDFNIIVAPAGQFAWQDGDGVRFIPAPPEPVIERPAVQMVEAVESELIVPPPSLDNTESAIAAIEAYQRKQRGEEEQEAHAKVELMAKRRKLAKLRGQELFAKGRASSPELGEISVIEAAMKGMLDYRLGEVDE